MGPDPLDWLGLGFIFFDYLLFDNCIFPLVGFSFKCKVFSVFFDISNGGPMDGLGVLKLFELRKLDFEGLFVGVFVGDVSEGRFELEVVGFAGALGGTVVFIPSAFFHRFN